MTTSTNEVNMMTTLVRVVGVSHDEKFPILHFDVLQHIEHACNFTLSPIMIHPFSQLFEQFLVKLHNRFSLVEFLSVIV
jgi:hypothetical protein